MRGVQPGQQQRPVFFCESDQSFFRLIQKGTDWQTKFAVKMLGTLN